MTPEELAAYCLGKPGAWPDEPWESDQVAKVGPEERGRIFAFVGSGSVGVKCGASRDEADEWLLRFPEDASVMAYIGRTARRGGTRGRPARHRSRRGAFIEVMVYGSMCGHGSPGYGGADRRWRNQ